MHVTDREWGLGELAAVGAQGKSSLVETEMGQQPLQQGGIEALHCTPQ